MLKKTDKIQKAYFEKTDRLETWSGLPVKEVYTPRDREEIDYNTRVGDPGQFPFTRGIHSDMYRGRYWTRREVSGFGPPEHTNERLKFQMDQGVSGLSFILDLPGGNQCLGGAGREKECELAPCHHGGHEGQRYHGGDHGDHT